ncbi:MAG: M14 family metallocarboxypeptidase [bacterium]|nr:M14 family metallocarboxypeptidase [bacterium]
MLHRTLKTEHRKPLQRSRHGAHALSAFAIVICTAAALLLSGCASSSHTPRAAARPAPAAQPGALSSCAIHAALTALAATAQTVRSVSLGASVRGTPLDAALISSQPDQLARAAAPVGRLRIMLVGTQHGMEPSGGDALVALAHDLAAGPLTSLLAACEFIIVPNSNPDGRDTNRRVNGNNANLSTDYLLLSQPESSALAAVLQRWQPHVVLDVHESAVLKKKTLGAQGFLIDFEAQFEGPNNPNVPAGFRTLVYATLLPEILTNAQQRGLPAQRYLGEITSTNQGITHGGLSLRNLRNYAGMHGTLGFLLESKLDPSTGSYATPRNIAERVRKQTIAITSLLTVCARHAAAITNATATARQPLKDITRGLSAKLVQMLPRTSNTLVYLAFTYVPADAATRSVPLRRIADGLVTNLVFPYYGAIRASEPVLPPRAFVITRHQDELARILTMHGIAFLRAYKPAQVPAVALQVTGREDLPLRLCGASARYLTTPVPVMLTVQEGDLVVPLFQAFPRLITLLLEPRSMASVFTTPQMQTCLATNTPACVYQVDDYLQIPSFTTHTETFP